MGCSPWGPKESDTTEWLSTHAYWSIPKNRKLSKKNKKREKLMGLHNSKVQGLHLQIWLDPGNNVLNTCSYFSSLVLFALYSWAKVH